MQFVVITLSALNSTTHCYLTLYLNILSSTAMREILGASQTADDSLHLSASVVKMSPFVLSGPMMSFTPATSLRASSGSFTPHIAASPMQPSTKKSRLSISTSTGRLNKTDWGHCDGPVGESTAAEPINDEHGKHGQFILSTCWWLVQYES